MKVKGFFQKSYIVLTVLLALPIRFFSFLPMLLYERLAEMGTTINAKFTDYYIYVPLMFGFFLVIVVAYSFLIKEIVKRTVDDAKIETDGRIPWFRVFLMYFSVGEIICFLFSMFMPGACKFGGMTAWPVYYVFIILYAIKAKRYSVIFKDHQYIAKDYGVFSMYYLIYEIVFILVLAFIFWMCYKKEINKDKTKITAWDKHEYAVFSFVGRFIAYLLFYFTIKNNVELYFLPFSLFVSFFIPIVVFRIYLKKKPEFHAFEINEKRELKKKIFWWILPSEIINIILSMTVFGFFHSFHFGRCLAYPAYAIFNYTYVFISGRGAEIAAGNYAVTDYVFFLICYFK